MLHTVNMTIHICFGSIAIILGLVPYFTKKGGIRHRQFGRYFLVCLSVVILTALFGVIFFRTRPFLTVVTILSFYMGFGGYRALKYKSEGPGPIDLVVVAIALLAGLSFLIAAKEEHVLWHASVVYYLLGYMFLFTLYDLLRIFKVFKNSRLWLIEHIVKMTSAYNALISAGLGTVLAKWEPLNQIIPAVIGTMIFLVLLIYYGRRVRLGRPVQ